MTTERFRMRHLVLLVVALSGLLTVVRHGAANAPPGRYTVTNGSTSAGTVFDTMTGLTWQQAVPSMSYAWAAAAAYCTSSTGVPPGMGWRLPSMQELQTIVDDSQFQATPTGATIDSTAFPMTPGEAFWTTSPFVPTTGMAWFVDFLSGTTGQDSVGTAHWVRCVR